MSGISIHKSEGQRIVKLIPPPNSDNYYLTIDRIRLENGIELVFSTDSGEPINLSVNVDNYKE